LARTFENTGITHSGVILGTPAYMSPEQALGDPGDVRSDLFSFGVIAFELLTGELPFPNSSLAESLLSRTRGRARSIEAVNPAIPAWLARIVMRCLERDPSNRYASAQEIVDDLLARDVCIYAAPDLSSGVLPPGTMVGSRYRIEAEAGEGGMGKVYRATDLDLHRTVALKVVRPDLASNSDTSTSSCTRSPWPARSLTKMCCAFTISAKRAASASSPWPGPKAKISANCSNARDRFRKSAFSSWL